MKITVMVQFSNKTSHVFYFGTNKKSKFIIIKNVNFHNLFNNILQLPSVFETLKCFSCYLTDLHFFLFI